jgi:hypothetical protein
MGSNGRHLVTVSAAVFDIDAITSDGQLLSFRMADYPSK